MKKGYEKPQLICEDLRPETLLCGCDVKNPNFSDLEMCGYQITIPGTDFDFRIFGQNWFDCTDPNTVFEGTEFYFCVHGPETTIFCS